MSPEATNEKGWEVWIDGIVIEDAIQRENIPFYRYSEFENVSLIGGDVYKAVFKTPQGIVVLKKINFNDTFTIDNLISDVS